MEVPGRVNKAIRTCFHIFWCWRSSCTNIALYGLGWLDIYLWVRVYLWVGVYYLATTHHKQLEEQQNICSAPLLLIWFLCLTHAPISHITAWSRLGSQRSTGTCYTSMGGSFSRNQNCWGKDLFRSNLPGWNFGISAKGRFKPFFLSEEYFLTGHWLETPFSQCLFLKIKYAIIFFP